MNVLNDECHNSVVPWEKDRLSRIVGKIGIFISSMGSNETVRIRLKSELEDDQGRLLALFAVFEKIQNVLKVILLNRTYPESFCGDILFCIDRNVV